MPVTGVHLLLYSPEAQAVRDLLRDAFDWPSVDAGGGWLIFRTPPAELGVHPTDHAHHEISLTCDDIDATVRELRAKGVVVRGDPEPRRFGRAVDLELPGGVAVLLYEPAHPLAPRGFVAEKRITISAPAPAVWRALTEPELIARYMFGTRVETDWSIGGPITWSGEWQGKHYEDKGTVLAFEPDRLLRATHWSPLDGTADRLENYRTVTYQLESRGGETELALTQDNNATRADAERMAENNWGPVLEALKGVAESL